MSCWCDGSDPGCETCYPHMLPEARAAFRADKAAMFALLEAAMREGPAADPAELARLAAAYRDARKETRRFDAIGRERVSR